jgi:hypothetical protein
MSSDSDSIEKSSRADRAMNEHFLRLAKNPPTPRPGARALRIYAYDPGQQTKPDMFDVSVTTVDVRWEDLKPGPIGEYVEVVDVDPASQACYAPIDLNDPYLLAQDGLPPSESSPQFHQQMVYAVAMRTIDRFEKALGRRALWASRTLRDKDGGFLRKGYVQRLRIYPHALREANAYYNPEKAALLFGYFEATADGGSVTRGSGVFAATSHDIIAHETTHALLDGLHPRYAENSNSDMAAFHEAFADIVALFQHFAMPDSLLRQVRQSKGAVGLARNLGNLAQQFGEATGLHGALRSFVGKTGVEIEEQRKIIKNEAADPHDRGAVLVAAVFAAFLTIYEARAGEIVRLATNGSGIVPDGDLSYDLSRHLAREASKTAKHVLDMCIRALDYCPPVNLTFGDYLRALVTADRDLQPQDERGYRVAFIDAFRERGILPENVLHLGEDSLLWEPPAIDKDGLAAFEEFVSNLDLRWNQNIARKVAWDASQANGSKTFHWLQSQSAFREALGFFEPRRGVRNFQGSGFDGEIRPIEVHSVRPLRRPAPDGSASVMLVVELTQSFWADPRRERYRGGCTLLVDLCDNRLKYVIRKKLSIYSIKRQNDARLAAARRATERGIVHFAANEPAGRAQAFAMMHRCAQGG